MNSDDIALAALSGLGTGAAGIKTLLSAGDSLDHLLSLSSHKLLDKGVDTRLATAISKADRAKAEQSLKRAEKGGAEIVSILNPDYPPLLKEIVDPPPILFILGDKGCLKEFCVGIVGSRKSSRGGINIAAELAGELAGCGITIVSGFAFGIDLSAHLAAADRGSTAAVLGSGFDNIYPREHIKYLNKICKKGCVLTEFPPEEKPAPYNFPKRNRVISGLCKGIIICEAGKRSGSLITARLALEQNRDVFAVPAFPASLNNATNRLIKDGAVLTESYLDVINEYKEIFSDICAKDGAPLYSPPEEHRDVWERLKIEPLSVDELAADGLAADMDYSKIILSITALEIEGLIERNAEGRYAVVNRRGL
jgi:DNA processing protein